jgi:hypothetical protein
MTTTAAAIAAFIQQNHRLEPGELLRRIVADPSLLRRIHRLWWPPEQPD